MPAGQTSTSTGGQDLTLLEGMVPSQQEAVLLTETAVLLDESRGDKAKLAEALERNLQLWTAVRTFVAHWEDGAPEDIRANLIRLADFICGTILDTGSDVDEATLNTLININLQISEGLLEGIEKSKTLDGPDALDRLSVWEQDAVLLSETAVMLDESRGDKQKLVENLERNLEIWTAIKAAVARWNGEAPATTKDNLVKLADFVGGCTLRHGAEIPDETLDALININLQISEGLLEGRQAQSVRDRVARIRDAKGA